MSLAARARLVPAGERSGAPSLRTKATEVPRGLFLAWGALLLNVLPPYGAASVLPIPHAMNQAIAQGSLLLAIVLALLVNPRIVIRPNLFMVLVSTMAVVALIVSIHSEFFVGSTYRAVRLCGFVLALWLLTPWWGRRELLLLRVHRLCFWVATGSVVLGVVISPGTAMGDQGRLSGTIWPMPAPQVAHYAAVLLGTTALLWMCRVIGGRHAALAIVVSLGVLLGTHTRTALLGCVVGLAVGSASLFLGHARVRRTSVWTIITAIVGGTVFAPQIVMWLARGQSAQDAAELTGRTKVWSAATEGQRPLVNELFGNGLSNKSFNGLPVDSNWVATYIDLGWFGIVMQVAFLLLLLLMAATHVRGLRRATALFLTVYCITASFTEVGPGDASPYLLDLFVAASLLAPRPDAVRARFARARRPASAPQSLQPRRG